MTDREDATDPEDDDTAAIITRRLAAEIRAEIQAAGGTIPFDRFMERALYTPGLGYYVAGAAKFGTQGDFVTAPEVSPLFGWCLAEQCREVLDRLDGGDILELGAGSGALAVQILERLATIGRLPDRYRILEPSPDLQERQRRLIGARIPEIAPRCEWLSALPKGWRGILIANEVLDAMPVNRFAIRRDGAVDEVFVGVCDRGFVEVTAPARSVGLDSAVRALQAVGLAKAPGYRSEINLRLAPWIAAIGQSLDAGLALLIDYGYPRAAYYQADRHMGTLLCHQRHQAHDDPYRDVGLQDITAHVDFTAVAEAGVASGFEVAGFTTQANLLIGSGIDQILAGSMDQIDATLGAKQLLLPSAMGERFKAIGLSRHLDGPLRAFAFRDLTDRL